MPALRLRRRVGAIVVALGAALGLALVPTAASAVIVDPVDGVTVTVSDSTFLADHSTIPVTVTNARDYPVEVRVRAWTASPLLDITSTPVTVDVDAGAQTIVEFPATSVSNGKAVVSAAQIDLRGRPIGKVSTAAFNVQAGWEGPIVAVIGCLVVAVAILGVVRTIVRVRRARREAATEQDARG